MNMRSKSLAAAVAMAIGVSGFSIPSFAGMPVARLADATSADTTAEPVRYRSYRRNNTAAAIGAMAAIAGTAAAIAASRRHRHHYGYYGPGPAYGYYGYGPRAYYGPGYRYMW